MSASWIGRIWRAIAQLAPWAGAVVCFFLVPSVVWVEASASLVTTLALISGAILLRIMRAFPVTDPDGFADVLEIDSLENALLKAMQSLAFAVGVAVAAILLLVFRSLLVDVSIGLTAIDNLRGEVYSAVLGWMTTFVAVRITYVVRMDFSIVRKQAKAVRLAFDKRRRREVEAARKAREDFRYDFSDDADYPGRRGGAGH